MNTTLEELQARLADALEIEVEVSKRQIKANQDHTRVNAVIYDLYQRIRMLELLESDEPIRNPRLGA